MLPPNAVHIHRICDVLLSYERGTTNSIILHTALDPTFHTLLEQSFTELFDITGKPTAIISAGGYVEKPGAHGMGRALDLDGFIWPTFTWRAKYFDSHPAFYYAILCHLSLTFGNVLGEAYNAAHEDHIHIDNLVSPYFRYNSRAVASTIQGALRNIFKVQWPHSIGSWDAPTRNHFNAIVPLIGKYPNTIEYKQFLKKARDKGLGPRKISDDQTAPSLEERVSNLEGRVRKLEELARPIEP